MKLTFYAIGEGGAPLRAAPATRTWMDETSDAFAYRCLPLNIANAHGWEFLAPCAFSARWDGGSGSGAIDIRCSAGSHARPTSIFGHGVLTFHVNGIFRTEPGWNLFIGGSPNSPKDGIYPLSGVIETDWSPYSFTMNWRFTRADHWISFDEGEPFCFVFPVQRGQLETAEPEIRELASDPALKAEYEQWSLERSDFTDRLMVKDSSESKVRWQKRYYRGLTMQNRPGIADHQAKLRLPEFADRRSPRAAPAARPPVPPEFFRKVVPLSRTRHGALGLRPLDCSFAATTPLISLAAVECVSASASYPLAFKGHSPPRPVCVVGGLPGINLQVNAAGAWRFGQYIPAAVRRFPFIVMADPGKPDALTLCVEEDTDLLDPAAPDKLFENGEMTAFGRERLQFAAQVAGEFRKTEALCRHPALDDLLMPARNAAPPRLAVRSVTRDLRVVDPARLRAIPESLRAEWHANGWLAALEAHVASARNWGRLLAYEDEKSATLVQPPDPAAPL